MEKINKPNRDIPVIKDADLPSMATHCPQEDCGESLYKGVRVRWDEDHDDRVLDFIDQMPVGVHQKLLVVQEHEAELCLIWQDEVPEGYEVGRGIEIKMDIPDEPGVCDLWMIRESKVA